MRECRRWARIGNKGRAKALRRQDLGKSRWFAPARQKRWLPGALEACVAESGL